MNAEIGKDENNKFCFHNSSNRNGEHLTEFLLGNELTFCYGQGEVEMITRLGNEW